MINALLRVLLAGVLLISSLACAAQRPVLYPNARLEAVGRGRGPAGYRRMSAVGLPPRGMSPELKARLPGPPPGAPESGPRWARPWARWPAAPGRARPWAPPGVARPALSGGSSIPGTWTRCSGGLWNNASRRKATRSSAGNEGQGGFFSTSPAILRLSPQPTPFKLPYALPFPRQSISFSPHLSIVFFSVLFPVNRGWPQLIFPRR